MQTLKQAQEEVQQGLTKGIKCPCCGQHAQTYKRSLSQAMVRALYAIYIAPDYILEYQGYLQVENYLKKLRCPATIRGDFPKLRFFDLIEPFPNDRPDGSSRNGYYKITQKGIDFVEGKICAPSYVLIYNNKMVGVSPDTITFERAKGLRPFTIGDITI